ncbi:hypothetical protein VT84_02520 [Gemmata sp. SH-PL17]|uniref:hypothetical protein n=1 Tax=Gemmata sp. SH-PL17 TaxID=1630693 RepID=UPI0004BCB39C|nr:hypothetical protein [Gemmata sp. SH-PL17]AMV23255.1 hypothetical protein VT84_02520 [Gemmata sp. SH-PL17]
MSEDDFVPPSTSSALALSPGTGGGLAGLAIGCTLLISACVLMVFNVILFGRGLVDVPRDLAQYGGLIGTTGVAILGLIAVIISVRSWSAARQSGESVALNVAATAASLVGLVAWLIAGIDLMMILLK